MTDLRRRSLLAVALLAPLSAAALDATPPPEVVAHLPNARLQGSGQLSFLGLRIYDARLWVGTGFRRDDHARSALAIELIYGRKLYGKLIAERSLSEMRKVGEVSDAQAERWLAEMARIFPDVDSGDRVVGLQSPGEAARFFANGRAIGEVRDAEFTRAFFGIWLSPQSSEPALRQSLLGGGRGGL